MVPFPVTLSDPYPRFQGHGVIFKPIYALSVLFAQLTRDLLAIDKFLFYLSKVIEVGTTDSVAAFRSSPRRLLGTGEIFWFQMLKISLNIFADSCSTLVSDHKCNCCNIC